MKNLTKFFFTAVMISIFFESVVSAHTRDNDSFTSLPIGTEIISKKSNHIKANGHSSFYFSSGQMFKHEKFLPSGKPYCVLTVEHSPYDREFTPDRSILVTTGAPIILPSSQDTAFNYSDPSLFVYFNQENNPYQYRGDDPTRQESDRYLICKNPNGNISPNSYDIFISIGDVKRILGDYFEIRLPQPQIIM